MANTTGVKTVAFTCRFLLLLGLIVYACPTTGSIAIALGAGTDHPIAMSFRAGAEVQPRSGHRLFRRHIELAVGEEQGEGQGVGHESVAGPQD